MIGNHLEPFKFWCQKVLPNVYDDSLSYYEYLCKLNEYLNEVIGQINTLTDNMSDYEDDLTAQWGEYKTGLNGEWTDYKAQLNEQWTYYKNYIDHYFDNLNVQTEINNKLDQMASDGTLDALIQPYVNLEIASQVSSWLTTHVDPVGSAVVVDNTFTINGAAANSKTVGDKALLNLGFYYNASGITESGYDDVDDLPVDSVISFGGNDLGVANLPSTNFKGTIVTLGGQKSITNFTAQMAFEAQSDGTNKAYYRNRYSSWNAWITIPKLSEFGAVELIGLYANASAVTTAGYTDADNFPVGSVITLASTSTNVSHVPLATFSGVIMTLGGTKDSTTFIAQIAYDIHSTITDMYYRVKYSNWSSWILVPKGSQYGYCELLGYYSTQSAVSDAGYTDADNFPIGSMINLGSASTNVAHLPSGFTGVVLTLGGNRDTPVFNSQLAFDIHASYRTAYYRVKHSTWSDWLRLPSDNDFDNNAYKALKNFVVCGDSLSVSMSYKQQGVSANVKSWAEYIADECHSTVLIKAQGGINTGEYLLSQLYTDAVADTKDYAILFLGTNDLNDNVDIPTFTSNYTSIINGLLTNHKFVFCVSLVEQVSKSGRNAFNTAIETICSNTEKAFYVNANAYNYMLTGYTNYGHCSSFGYAVLSNMIKHAINDTIKANGSYFNYVLDF